MRRKSKEGLGTDWRLSIQTIHAMVFLVYGSIYFLKCSGNSTNEDSAIKTFTKPLIYKDMLLSAVFPETSEGSSNASMLLQFLFTQIFLHGFQVAYRMDYLTVSTSAHSPSSCRKRMKSPFLWRMTCNHNLVIFCKLSSSRVQITLFLLLPWYSLVFLSSSFAAAESSIVSIPVLHIAAADASTGQLFSPSRQFHLQRRLSPSGSSLDSRLPQSSRVAPKLPRSSSPRE